MSKKFYKAFFWTVIVGITAWMLFPYIAYYGLLILWHNVGGVIH